MEVVVEEEVGCANMGLVAIDLGRVFCYTGGTPKKLEGHLCPTR